MDQQEEHGIADNAVHKLKISHKLLLGATNAVALCLPACLVHTRKPWSGPAVRKWQLHQTISPPAGDMQFNMYGM